MRRVLLSIFATVVLMAPFFTGQPVFAQTGIKNAQGMLGDLEATVLPGDNLQPQQIIANIFRVALSMVGVVFIVLIIYGGYTWGTARGSEEKVETGKKLIFEATVGLVIIFGAYFVTAFVIQQVGNATIGGIINY